jgi:hypothetical protein
MLYPLLMAQDPLHTTLTLRELYPSLTAHELAEVEANLRRYIQLAAEIFDDSVADPISSTFDSP